MPPQIEIIHVPHLEGSKSPARCNRKTGQIWINDSIMNDIDPAHRFFILLHELGHIKLNTPDEYEADRYASEEFVKRGYPLTESVKALSRVLTGSTDEHVSRVAQQLNRANEIDQKFNKKSMCNSQSLISNCTGCSSCQGAEYFDGDATPWYNYSDEFDGYKSINCLELKGRKRRQCLRATKREGANNVKMTRAEGNAAAKTAKAEAKRILAEQGIDAVSISGAVGQIAGAFSKPEPQGAQMPNEKPKSNTKKILIWVGVSVAVLGLGALVYFKFIKK